MALSNWDTLALDHENKPTSGSLMSTVSGVEVEIYKNWIYIHDEKAWQDGEAFSKPIVMSIECGEVRYKDICILAFRGPQSGIYVLVWVEGHAQVTVGMLGIGVYGYDDSNKWIGVLKSSLDWFKTEVLYKRESIDSDSEYLHEIPDFFRSLDLTSSVRFNQGDMYFAEKAGLPVQATPPEEVEEPHLHRILDAMKEMK